MQPALPESYCRQVKDACTLDATRPRGREDRAIYLWIIVTCTQLLLLDIYVLQICMLPASAPGDYDPCVDNEVEIYFNREDVQRALHANVTHMPGPWKDCNPNIAYSM